MKFEFDPTKSLSNKAKHGVDFTQAQSLWDDENGLVFPVSFQGERRFLLTAVFNEKHGSAIFALRGDAIRIISVRRARPDEVNRYESF
jgi:uncharacterized protein